MSEENKLVPNDALIQTFIDLPDLLARVENDRELLTELFVMFREELPARHSALHKAIDIGDLPQAARAAHTLKGMLANMSINKATTIAARIELEAQRDNMSAVKETIASFDSEIAALSAALDAFIVGT